VPPAVFYGSASYPAGQRTGPVVTIGNFDGVHLGHQALLRRVRQRADELGVAACVYTFHPSPRQVLRPSTAVPPIQDLDDRIEALGRAGVDEVVVERFDHELAAREPRWFADEILARRLRCSAAVLGYDFRYGRRREGTVDMLREWLDVPVEQVEPLSVHGAPVSSTRIRELLLAGDVEEAAALLSRPHRLRGEVVAGDRRGRQLGFPTANVAVGPVLRPPSGVYAVRVGLDHEEATRPAVANLGTRPTFGDGDAPTVEVHLLDFSGDLYGRRVAVDFIARLRDERRFDGVEQLVGQIRADIDEARRRLAP